MPASASKQHCSKQDTGRNETTATAVSTPKTYHVNPSYSL
jgi:hypothetical protein